MNVRALSLLALALLPSVALAQTSKDVTGTVQALPSGAPVIHTDQGDFSIAAEPWRSFLASRVGMALDARLRVSSPTGGPATVQALYRQIVATVQLPVGGAPMLVEDRSNAFQIEGEPWRAFLMNVVDRRVEARIQITDPGQFGGKARIERLWRGVTGKVLAAADGGPVMISEDRSNGYQVDAADWKDWLLGRVDQQVTVRLEVTRPGQFGGKAAIVHASLGALEGWAQAPGSLSVNKSLTLQVTNAPFRGLIAAAAGLRVKAEVRLVKPGMFGGEAVVDAILTRNQGGPIPVLAHASAGPQPVLARIATGRPVAIVGATGAYYRVQVRTGVFGYVQKAQLAVGAQGPTAGIVALVPGH